MTLRLSRRPFLILILLGFLGTGGLDGGIPCSLAGEKKADKKPVANTSASASLPEIPPAVRQAEATAATLKQEFLEAEQQTRKTAEHLAEVQQRLRGLESEIPALAKSLGEAEERLGKEQAEAAAAGTQKEKAAEKKEDDKALKDAEKRLAEATAQARKTEAEIGMLKQRSAEAAKEKAQAVAEIPKAEQQEKVSRESAEKLQRTWKQQDLKIEQLLKEAGLWVSFSQEIAPLLAGRCLACHNAKKPEGGLNLESYAALTAGGESGPVIDREDRETSSLLTLTQDGSMPKDADPLSPEELALLGRWVVTGGRLDQGVKAGAELIQIMPRMAQPEPPKTYRRPLPVTALAFSPDGKLLASSGYHEIQLWDVKTGVLARRISNVAERVYRLDFSPNGELIAVAAGTPGRVGEVKVFQTADGRLTADLLITSEVQLGVAFSPDGLRLASGGGDRKVRVFDLKTKQPVLEIEPHLDWVTDVAWSADGKSLVTCGMDKTARIVRADSGESIVAFNGHKDAVTAAAFLPEGNQVISAGGDRVLRIWSASDAAEIRKISGFGAEISALAVLPDQRVATSGLDRQARIHQLSDGRQILTLGNQPEPLYAVAVHPGAGLIATGSLSGEILLSRLADGKQVGKWTAAPPVSLSAAAPPAKESESAKTDP